MSHDTEYDAMLVSEFACDIEILIYNLPISISHALPIIYRGERARERRCECESV